MKGTIFICLFVVFNVTSCYTIQRFLPDIFGLTQSPSVTSLIRNSRNFSVSLLNNLVVTSDSPSNSQKNVLFSPLGVSNVLAMLRLASGGRTRDEFDRLALFQDNDDVNSAFQSLNNMLMDPLVELNHTELSSTNLLFADQTLVPSIHQRYLAEIIDYFSASIGFLDFHKSPKSSSDLINKWVSYKTRDNIKNLFGPGDITTSTQLVMANTVIFRNVWHHQFNYLLTKDGKFELLNGTKIMVPMMQQTATYRYRALCTYDNDERVCENASRPDVIELPFKDNRKTEMRLDEGLQKMIILLPNKRISLKEIEENFHSKIDEWRMNMELGKIKLTMPRCNVQYEVDMKNALQSEGLRSVFQDETANFTLLAEKNISVAKFVHKATIELNESGMLASSASGVIITTRSSFPRESFKVNRPFMFFIEDVRTKAMVFLGRITDPR